MFEYHKVLHKRLMYMLSGALPFLFIYNIIDLRTK